MLPVDVGGTGADFWVGNFHKWAYAPRGTAVLAVAPPWRERIEPLVVSWEQPSGFPARVEWQATLDYTPWLAAPIGLFTMRNLGIDAVRAHNVALAAYGQAVVGAALGRAAGRPAGPRPRRVDAARAAARRARHRLAGGGRAAPADRGRPGHRGRRHHAAAAAAGCG